MQIPSPHSLLKFKAKDLFKRIYKNQTINYPESKATLKDQLEIYLEHLSEALNKKISIKDKKRILDILIRNNHVASLVSSKEFKKLTESKKSLLGDTNLGLVYCIDGRIPAIFLGGRYANHWEVPAAQINVMKRKSDNKLIPESNDLCEALRKLVIADKDLLEIVFAHTSTSDPTHGCGAMAVKRKMGLLDKNLTNEQANIKIIEEVTIPAISQIYNDFRLQNGLEPLKVVGIPALYDTDTFGFILNFGKNSNQLSTTDLTQQHKDGIEEYFIKENLVYGVFKQKFTYLKYLTQFSKNILQITKALFNNKRFQVLSDHVNSFIDGVYKNLTEDQKKVLKFVIFRTIAFQYLVGTAGIKKAELTHPFAHHEEEYMAVSTRGITIGKYDPLNQGFSSTPADPQIAISNIKTKMSIMNASKHHQNKAFLLFVCNPINKKSLSADSTSLHKILDSNAELFRSIVEDSQLLEMVKNLGLVLIPVLVDDDTREVLKIVDHSVYI